MNTYFFLLRVFLTGTSSSASSAFRLAALAGDLLVLGLLFFFPRLLISSRSVLLFSEAFLAAALPRGLMGELFSSRGSGTGSEDFFVPLLAGFLTCSTCSSGSGADFFPFLA